VFLICRGKAAEIFFETFNVPALYVQVQAILSLSVDSTLKQLQSQQHSGADGRFGTGTQSGGMNGHRS